MTPQKDCIFCKIVAGDIPSKKVYADNECYAFHDAHPTAPVHVLLIPRRHIATLADCGAADARLLGGMMLLVPHLAKLLGIGDQDSSGGWGFRTVINTGPGGGQEVYHLHIHILGGKRL